MTAKKVGTQKCKRIQSLTFRSLARGDGRKNKNQVVRSDKMITASRNKSTQEKKPEKIDTCTGQWKHKTNKHTETDRQRHKIIPQ